MKVLVLFLAKHWQIYCPLNFVHPLDCSSVLTGSVKHQHIYSRSTFVANFLFLVVVKIQSVQTNKNIFFPSSLHCSSYKLCISVMLCIRQTQLQCPTQIQNKRLHRDCIIDLFSRTNAKNGHLKSNSAY